MAASFFPARGVSNVMGSLRFVKDEVTSESGMVTASMPSSAEAGLRILKTGGNAFDAGVAMGFCNTVLEPYLAGLGGLGFMVAFSAEEGKVVSIDFNTRAPRAARPEMFKVVGDAAAGGTKIFEVEGNANSVGGKALTIPATCAGFLKAHELYGVLPLGDVVEPARKLAAEGFTLGWDQALVLGVLARESQRCPAIDDVWLPGGFPAAPGTRIVQADLARLLGRIAVEGRDAVYSGEVAEKVEEAVSAAGGVMTAEDLADYEPIVGQPIKIGYRDLEVATTSTPSGGVTILETMKILEGFDLAAMGHNSGEYLHTLVEASRHAFADRYSLLGDWEHADVPLAGLLSDSYAEQIRSLISERASFPKTGAEPWVSYLGAPAHDPWAHEGRKRPKQAAASSPSPAMGETSHFNAVDSEGNAVACTHTPGFQAGVVPEGTGLYLTAAMGWFIPAPGYPNSVAPWKRPMMNMGPLMILRDGAPILVEGAPGSRRIIERNLQVVLNILEFGMGPQEAVSAPTVDASGLDTLVDNRIPHGAVDILVKRGHRVKVVEEGPGLSYFARPSAILIEDERLRGGVDLYRRSTALGH
ncbi:MAG: gamma-glutamyltransferase family protein [Candidatus Bathyarchaeota archaeon]|nr:gamma-glutamyltransferase family protein [Candidatus Bathyarchaeota archaeon]